MYRKCDLQQNSKVIRGWISEENAVEGVDLILNNYSGFWTVIRAHAESGRKEAVDVGTFIELHKSYLKTR